MKLFSWISRGQRDRTLILQSLARIEQKLEKIDMEEKDLQNDLDQIKSLVVSKIDSLNATIADLRAQVAAGTPVTQEQLDSLDAEAKDIITKLSA